MSEELKETNSPELSGVEAPQAEATKPKKPKKSEKVEEAKEPETPVTEPKADVEAPKTGTMKPKSFEPNQLVTVFNGTQGKLVYISKKTQERFIWDEFGDAVDMELSELKSAKSSNKIFYINNWFVFDDPAVVDYLGVGAYYKNALTLEDFETFFQQSPEELTTAIAGLSKGQKKTVAFRAKKLVEEGDIDSMKVVTALEKALGMELIEH